MFSIVAWSTLSCLPKDSQHGVISLAKLSRVIRDGAVGFNGCKCRVQKRVCPLVLNKLFYSNVLYCGLVHPKLSS